MASANDRNITLQTEKGRMTVALEPGLAPLTAANFLRHVRSGVLDRAEIYRIVTLANRDMDAAGSAHPIEIIEWGLPYRHGVPDPAFAPIPHEGSSLTGLRHRHGTLSMARFAIGTACSNFFFCIGDQPALDQGGGRHPDGQGFAAFGRVVAGMDTLARLHATAAATEYLPHPLPIRPVHRCRAR